MTAAEFQAWCAFYRLSPWGEERADLRAGIVASTIANAHGGRRGRPYQPKDFMPNYMLGRERMSDDEMAAKLKAFAKDHNARMGRAVPSGG